MTAVERGEHKGNVIVKACQKDRMSELRKERWRREVDLLQVAAGPGIARFISELEDDRYNYLVMEACPGMYQVAACSPNVHTHTHTQHVHTHTHTHARTRSTRMHHGVHYITPHDHHGTCGMLHITKQK